MPRVLDNIQVGLLACRIGIRLCCQWMWCSSPMVVVQEEYKVLCLGLSGAGKSTVLATLVGENISDVEPTTGFNIKTLPLKDTVLNIKELGGGANVYPFWNRYFEGQHGLLFVIDASCSEDELNESTDRLQNVLADDALSGIPCLILATHQDVEDSRTLQQIEHHFKNLMYSRKWQVQVCGLEDKNSIIESFETLIDLMSD